MLALQSCLYSTSGEIALAAGDLNGAEGFFEQGLALAEQHIIWSASRVDRQPGLVARQRGMSLAIHRLSAAMAILSAQLAAQIRLWLAPLLPRREATKHLAEARVIAEEGGRRLLLAEIERLETELSTD